MATSFCRHVGNQEQIFLKQTQASGYDFEIRLCDLDERGELTMRWRRVDERGELTTTESVFSAYSLARKLGIVHCTLLVLCIVSYCIRHPHLYGLRIHTEYNSQLPTRPYEVEAKPFPLALQLSALCFSSVLIDAKPLLNVFTPITINEENSSSLKSGLAFVSAELLLVSSKNGRSRAVGLSEERNSYMVSRVNIAQYKPH